MALATSGLSLVRRSSSAHAVEPAARPVGEQSLERHEVEHLPVGSPASTSRWACSGAASRSWKSPVKKAACPREQDVGVVGAPSGSTPSRAAAAVSRSPDITALRASRTRRRRPSRSAPSSASR